VQTFGDATELGDVNASQLGSGETSASLSATPSGKGYWVFTNPGPGDRVRRRAVPRRRVSLGAQRACARLGRHPAGDGYYMDASDGGIFAFDAPFKGSLGGVKLNKPVVGMVRYGDGYLMVGADGGIFNFSTLPFSGSLGGKPPAAPVVAVAALP
jgi:hypothetical protein